MNKLSMESRKVAIDMLTSGISQRKVAMSMKCTHGAIQKLWKKFLATDSIQNIKNLDCQAKLLKEKEDYSRNYVRRIRLSQPEN